VDVIDDLLANNRAFADSLSEPRAAPARLLRRRARGAGPGAAPAAAGELGELDARPRLALAVVACMDSRIEIIAALGLRHGDAHVLRNAGGAITDDVIRSLAVSQHALGTRAVMLVHHTDCGMQRLSDGSFRAELERAAGVPPPFAIESFDDLDLHVRESIDRVRRSPFVPHRDAVRGFVYDVESHRLREVPAAAHREPPTGID